MTDFQPFSPIEEHYLKRELLRIQLQKELEELNNPLALRNFGYPFTQDDPKIVAKSLHTSPIKRTISHVTRSPSKKIQEEQSDIVRNCNTTEFPMLSYIVQEFIMSFPLFARNLSIDESFWQTKVQIFFEHFMTLGFSDSMDREQSTKRKKIGQKLNKIVLLLFNSGIGTRHEGIYYSQDKFTLENENVRKRSKVEDFAIPTKETLQKLVTTEPMFINGWDINIVAVIPESSMLSYKGKTKKNSSKPSVTSSFPMKSFSSTSKWMKNAFNVSNSPTALLSKLSLTGTTTRTTTSKKRHYRYLIKVRSTEHKETIIYVAKSYQDLKQLSHDLKSIYPGKKFPRLPHKTKKSVSVVTAPDYGVVINNMNNKVPSTPVERIINSFETETMSLQSSSNKSTSSLQESYSQPLTKTNSQSMPDLNEPLAKVETDEKEQQEREEREEEDEEEFDDDDDDDDESDKDSIFHDVSDQKTSCLAHEKMRTSLRQYLRTLSKDKEVSESHVFQEFLSSHVANETEFNNEIKEDIKNRELVDINNLENQLKFQRLALEKSLKLQDSMKEFKASLLKDDAYLLSLMVELKTKNKISELSALPRGFIEWSKIYLSSIIYQLFLGNDNSYGFYTQIRRLHKLMPYKIMEQIMRFTNPMIIMKNMMDLFMAQPFGGQSLLQTMFSTILTDDLKSQKHIIKKLEDNILKNDDAEYARLIITCLKNTIFQIEKPSSDQIIDMGLIHEESETLGMPIVLLILMKSAEKKIILPEAVDELIESYSLWKIKGREIDSHSLYFQHIKELFQLYIKEHDKRLMRQLWQDPELSQLLKATISLIYEPMIKIFKVARIDVALKNFQRFMDDLIKLMDDIINGQVGTSTQFSIIDSINNLVTKHQDSFFDFVHDVYINDTEGIFEGFVTWIAKIIKFLQVSKFGRDEERIDFNSLLSAEVGRIDVPLLRKQVDEVINKKLEARKLYSKLLDLKIESDPNLNNDHANKVLERKWEQVNSMVIPKGTITFGVHDSELVDLDLDVADYDYLQKEGEIQLEQKYEKLLNQNSSTEEIQKVRSLFFEDCLRKVLKPLD
ncbi:hypothetical protein KAFR_0H00680 [Kazachstania africana CBS 2517]|uniref:PX domain-containing protein n=1 Tax=Kazachstania africana (strain ATCC 22294 / BCRC 22015 / CBS 2517 / CECT 1963 / NBRC 1671 / NRRL Y-8276) TaxID=1071382 RepID=H2AYS1_KAZAF|nr:hypothetical protein KAFR_0H00680 [Kazachstania africana CBS 2517]CCF59477.1 hypothetical protein KAFR_0H00680 [Kazachstania africana CBS 2517]